MRISIHKIILSAVSLCSIFDFGYSSSISEREVVRSISDSVVNTMIDEAGIVPASSVFFQYEQGTSQPVFYNSITRTLLSRGISIVQQKSLSDTSFVITMAQASIHYGDTFSESFLGSEYVCRTVTVSYEGVLSTAAKVLWSGINSISCTDTVQYSEIKDLHSDDIPLSSYTLPPMSVFNSIFEPLLVSIASGVAIYLFFTIRS